MDLHQLKVFQSAVKHGSFTRASKELYLSQSTISQHIKQLEQELGCQLFMRVGKRVLLTDAGSLLHDHCQKIFQDVKNAEMAVREMTGVIKGKVRFGTGATTLIYQLPPVLELYQSKFPSIELVIISDTTDSLITDLRAQRLDLGLVMQPVTESDLQFTPLCEEELKIAIPHRHPLARKQSLTIQDLKELRFILYEQKTVMRNLIDNFFIKLGVTPQIAMVMENIEAIKSLVGAGLGSSVLPIHAVGNEAIDKKVKMMRIEKFPLHRQLGLITLKSNFTPNAVQRLFDLLIQELGAKSKKGSSA